MLYCRMLWFTGWGAWNNVLYCWILRAFLRTFLSVTEQSNKHVGPRATHDETLVECCRQQGRGWRGGEDILLLPFSQLLCEFTYACLALYHPCMRWWENPVCPSGVMRRPSETGLLQSKNDVKPCSSTEVVHFPRPEVEKHVHGASHRFQGLV